MPTLIVFDADNTLWDTDAVFREAQSALLHALVAAGIPVGEVSVEALRSVDRALARETGQFEYDFRLLGFAIALQGTLGLSPARAAQKAVLADNIPIRLLRGVDAAHRAYEERIHRIPPLLAGAGSTFQWILDRKCSSLDREPTRTVLFSEGRRERIERILAAHGLLRSSLFDDIRIGKKTPEEFEALKHQPWAGLRHGDRDMRLVMVGDSLQRDIRPASPAGFTTIYKPAGLHGFEEPGSSQDQPTYKIESLRDLPQLLTALCDGVPVTITSRRRQAR